MILHLAFYLNVIFISNFLWFKGVFNKFKEIIELKNKLQNSRIFQGFQDCLGTQCSEQTAAILLTVIQCKCSNN